MGNTNDLNYNKADLISSIGKSAVGVIPIAGPFLSEIIGSVIPNQRIDRLTKFVQLLDEKVSLVPQGIIEELKTNDKFIDLLEEGFIQASRSLSDQRRSYISSILVNGMKSKSVELEHSKYLIKILQEINDVEVIWLKFHKIKSLDESNAFRKKHKNIFTPDRVYLRSDKATLQKAALNENYSTHLERLGLVKNHVRINRETKLPIYHKLTGQPEISHTDITEMGNMLLEQIEITEE